jgi:hypothetical protein
MTNHFFVIDPQGKVHTRSSKDRVYTHTVLSYIKPVTYQDQIDAVDWAVSNSSDSYWQSMKHIADTGVLDHLPDFDVERRVQEARNFIAKNPSLELYMARIGANALANFDAKVASGHFDRWVNLGWNGRLDLAQKLQAQSTAGKIYEAQVGKPPKGTPKAK